MRGARIETLVASVSVSPSSVAPRAGARIETSTPSDLHSTKEGVAPRAGARIETSRLLLRRCCWLVAPRAGARIETHGRVGHVAQVESPPVRGRGLKQEVAFAAGYIGGRPPCGGAD